jgi:hypothetical protein
MKKTKMSVLALLVAVAFAWSGLPVGSAVDHKDHKASDDHKHAHPGDPIKAEEHQALFDLVADGEATHIAVASGNWGDPKTWDKNAVPADGARVIIPSNRTVTVAGQHDKSRVDWLRVDGTLRFDPKVNTSLKVVTLVGNVKSTIEIGTEKERIESGVTARLILGDRGQRNDSMRKRDPYDLSGGLLAHGRSIHPSSRSRIRATTAASATPSCSASRTPMQ